MKRNFLRFTSVATQKRAVPAHDSFLLLIKLILPMVFFASADFKSTVNLLNQQQANHLMRKGHFRKAQRQIGTLTQRISITKGTANHKGDMAVAGKRQLIQLCRQIRAAQLLADDIQQNHIGICRDNCQQALRFALQYLLLFRRRWIIRHTLFVNCQRFQLAEGCQPFAEFLYSRSKIFFFNFSYTGYRYLQLP